MKIQIVPGPLAGTVPAIASKSDVHRLLICAALAERETIVSCATTSADIEATARCLRALGASVEKTAEGFSVKPIPRDAQGPALPDCGESGSTYRFLAPVAAALGRTATFSLSGKLPGRPMQALWAALEANGAVISGEDTAEVTVSGRLRPGRYIVPGGVSSQYVSGLLFALPLLGGDSEIVIDGALSSASYVELTLDALAKFSQRPEKTSAGFAVTGGRPFVTPERAQAQGDWSNAAFWLCMGAAAGTGITVTGLSQSSPQGDRAVCELLRRFGAAVQAGENAVTVRPGPLHGVCVDADAIPDLIPALAIAAAAARGESVFENVGRLRLKESDRVQTVCQTIRALGGQAWAMGSHLVVRGEGCLRGGCAHAGGDHRIAMLAAGLAVLCRESVTIDGAQAVEKSYPRFYKDYASLGGVLREGSL